MHDLSLAVSKSADARDACGPARFGNTLAWQAILKSKNTLPAVRASATIGVLPAPRRFHKGTGRGVTGHFLEAYVPAVL